MRRFLARVALTSTFANERMKDVASFWQDILLEIPEEANPEESMFRLTFGSFFVSCETILDCYDMLEKAYYNAMGGLEGYAGTLVTPYYDDETFDLMRMVYNNYYGVESYQQVITEMTDALPLLRERDAVDVIRRQHYLFAIDDGCGFSTLISSLGDYLRRMKVYTEEGEKVRCYYDEQVIGKESEDGYMSADELYEKLRDIDSAENPYTIIGLDISFYLEGNRFPELRKLLHRLERFQEKFVFAFRVPFLEKKAFDEIKNLFMDIMNIKIIQIPPHSDAVLMEHFWNILKNKEFQPTESMIDTVLDRIHEEKMDGRFYGFRTIEKIADEVMFLKAMHFAQQVSNNEEADHDRISAEHLKGLVDRRRERLTGYAELEEMIGMESITQKIREIIAQVKIAMENDNLDRPCIHMRFTGAPGTGKTTVARIIGEIMREEGILRKGGFFEYSGRDLVAEYVGQTAVKTAGICRDSYGSVLFIDEAYSLYEGGPRNNDFGKEALTTLISEMENHRDDMLVIMAGYTDEMDTLMKGNSGLRSRMPRVLHFPSYDKDQLFQIFMLMVKKHFKYEPELEKEAKRFFMDLSQEYIDSKEFANARFVRNLYERTWSKAALRQSLDRAREIVLSKEDFLAASGENEFSEKIDQKRVLGF